MLRNVLTPDVREFVSLHVGSMADLQVLVALFEDDGRWWDAQSMSVRTGVDPARARQSLEALAAQNLLDIRVSDAVRYRLHPGSDDLTHGLHALAAAYRKYPTAVVKFVAGAADTESVTLRKE
jgi:hypothetical protein